MFKHFIDNPQPSDYIIIIPKQINDLSIDVILPEYENKTSHINLSELPSKKNKTIIPKINSTHVAEINHNNTLSMKYLNNSLAQQHLQNYNFRLKIIKFLHPQIDTNTINTILQKSHDFPPNSLEDTIPAFFISKYIPLPQTKNICENYKQKIIFQSITSFQIFSNNSFHNTLQTLQEINEWGTNNNCNSLTFIKSPIYNITISHKNTNEIKKIQQNLHKFIQDTCIKNNTTLIDITHSNTKIINKNY